MDTKEAFCGYFAAGANPGRRIGVELEHFVLKADGSVCAYDEGSRRILEALAPDFEYKNVQDGHLIGVANDDYCISLEPGAQLEVSISPKENIRGICASFESFYKRLAPELAMCGVRLAAFGALDRRRVDKIPLIPKKRYEYMDRYFAETGSCGRYMMRASASCQFSVDYADEADFVKKFRAAYLLTPVFALLAANGGEGGFLKRIEIWDNVDPARTWVPEDLFSPGFGFGSYAEKIMDTPAIFMPQAGYTGDAKIGELAEKYGTDDEALEHFLSMVFPDVRLKKYIEIRVGDAMEYKAAAAYAAFGAAVLYRGADAVLRLLKDAEVGDIAVAKHAVARGGFDAEIYGMPARKIVEFIAGLAPEEWAELAHRRGDFENAQN